MLTVARWLCGVIIALSMPAQAVEPTGYLDNFSRTRAIIETSGLSCIPLDVYIADTSAQHRQGLMFIEHLDDSEGMIFRYTRDTAINMWMKNTLIPLDMLFIRADGIVAGIARRTTPMSTKRLASPGPVRYVLEVNGGWADARRVEPGNRLLVLN